MTTTNLEGLKAGVVQEFLDQIDQPGTKHYYEGIIGEITERVWNAALDACRDQINTSYSEWPEYTDETLGYHQKQLKAIDSLKDPQG